MLPSERPLTAVEWLAPPVVVKVFVMEEYATPGVVEYLHVAASFVVSDMVIEVVPEERFPDGEPDERTGGVVSGVYVTLSISVLVLPAASCDVTIKVFVPGYRVMPMTDQVVVPVAVPLPPILLFHVTDATPTLSDDTPPRSIEDEVVG